MSTVEQQISEEIQKAISGNEVILFMKGTPEAPRCGFSARTVAVLEALGKPFAAVDILPDPRIRQELSTLSGWPTIPQVFVKGELIGGADIVEELEQTGELEERLTVGLGESYRDAERRERVAELGESSPFRLAR